MIIIVSLIILIFFILLTTLGKTSIEPIVIPDIEEIEPNSLNLKPGLNKVKYKSMGQTIVANLFVPLDYKVGEKRSAAVITPPATSVKEQSSQVYAEKISKLGYITLAFDPRGIGESEGIKGDINPFHSANDISSSFTFLESLDEVDTNKLFSVGICANALSAAYESLNDDRIKALIMVVPSLNASELAGGTFFISRWFMYILGGIANLFAIFNINLTLKAIPETQAGINKANSMTQGMATYYPEGKIGHHPRWSNDISMTAGPGLAKLHIFDYAKRFKGFPIYMVTGEKAQSLEPAIRFYNSLNNTKELLLIKNSDHFELYWNDEYVDPAINGINSFLKKHL